MNPRDYTLAQDLGVTAADMARITSLMNQGYSMDEAFDIVQSRPDMGIEPLGTNAVRPSFRPSLLDKITGHGSGTATPPSLPWGRTGSVYSPPEYQSPFSSWARPGGKFSGGMPIDPVALETDYMLGY